MCYIKNTFFAARLASAWRVGIASIKSWQIAIGTKTLTATTVVLNILVRLLLIELPTRGAGAFNGTCGRTMLAVRVNALTCDWKWSLTLSAVSHLSFR